MMEKVKAYKCDFCKDEMRRLFLSRSGCAKHEKQCWLNPARKSCSTCANLIEGVKEIEELLGVAWACLARKDIIPFTSKISHCLYWKERNGIFTNEKPNFNRPIERKTHKRMEAE